MGVPPLATPFLIMLDALFRPFIRWFTSPGSAARRARRERDDV